MNRVAAVVAADLRIRFRRASTVVVFLLLSALAYVWVPDPATGSTLIEFNGKRAIYNSAAIAVGTATLATVFIGLVGFYVISNAVRRDVTSRCGFVIASTTMRGTEYLLGKFAGNVIFLATFMAGFMVSSMAMLIVRGEAPLQPAIFIWQYVLLVPPTMMFVSGLAILFESIPFLSGKFGDVVYFFVWAASLGFVAAALEKGRGPGLIGYFDFSGFGFLMDTLRRTMHTTHVSIGHTTFDRAKGVFVFPGLQLDRSWIMPRIVATIAPAALVLVARPFFHRFDPARVKVTAHGGGRSWLRRIGSIAKPLTRFVSLLAPHSGGSLFGAARTDALMTIASSPVTVLIAIAFAIAPRAAMPFAFAVAAIVIADISCREKRAGSVPLVFSTPRVKSGFVAWKLMSSTLVAALVLFVPAVRQIVHSPRLAPYVLCGVLVIVAFATFLGVVSSNPKTFIVLFLTFWYIVLNDKGHTPALDFAGFHGTATPAVLASYVLLSVLAIAGAEAFHRADLRRNW